MTDWTDAEVELVAETVAADLGLEAWQVRRASAAALRTLAAARRTPTEATGEYEVDVVYPDGSVFYRRVEHGNRADTCGACTLAPSVSGWARATQARCPVHGGPSDTEEETDGR